MRISFLIIMMLAMPALSVQGAILQSSTLTTTPVDFGLNQTSLLRLKVFSGGIIENFTANVTEPTGRTNFTGEFVGSNTSGSGPVYLYEKTWIVSAQQSGNYSFAANVTGTNQAYLLTSNGFSGTLPLNNVALSKQSPSAVITNSPFIVFANVTNNASFARQLNLSINSGNAVVNQTSYNVSLLAQESMKLEFNSTITAAGVFTIMFTVTGNNVYEAKSFDITAVAFVPAPDLSVSIMNSTPGTPALLNANISNNGLFAQNATVVIYSDNIQIQNRSFELEGYRIVEFNFTLDFGPHNVNISVLNVSRETYTANNNAATVISMPSAPSPSSSSGGGGGSGGGASPAVPQAVLQNKSVNATTNQSVSNITKPATPVKPAASASEPAIKLDETLGSPDVAPDAQGNQITGFNVLGLGEGSVIAVAVVVVTISLIAAVYLFRPR